MRIGGILSHVISGQGALLFEDPGHHETTPIVNVSQEWLDKHKPEIGGYFVVYEDGYQSYSPAKAFEEGYTRL